MKSFLCILTVLAILSLPAVAADTNTVFQWQRPDQSGLLTVSNLNLKGAVSLPAGTSVGNLSVVLTNVQAQTAAVSVPITPSGAVTLTNVYADVTNVFTVYTGWVGSAAGVTTNVLKTLVTP